MDGHASSQEREDDLRLLCCGCAHRFLHLLGVRMGYRSLCKVGTTYIVGLGLAERDEEGT